MRTIRGRAKQHQIEVSFTLTAVTTFGTVSFNLSEKISHKDNAKIKSFV